VESIPRSTIIPGGRPPAINVCGACHHNWETPAYDPDEETLRRLHELLALLPEANREEAEVGLGRIEARYRAALGGLRRLSNNRYAAVQAEARGTLRQMGTY
jgi:hypothetical protein